MRECLDRTQLYSPGLALLSVLHARGGVLLRVGQSQVDVPPEKPGVGVVLQEVDHSTLGSVEG